MGNALGCVGLGERLAAAARDGDAAAARRLLAADPGLARCSGSTFGSLSSPLQIAASKGHHEIAALLLENGADANARNLCGQTPLIQACRSGHWEVVQTLLAFGCNVWRADGLSGRTALHVAAAGGHVRCVRLLLAGAGAGDDEERVRYVNKAAGGGGVTALHLAALQGHVECVHLLADERARLDAQTLPCAAAPMASVGAGSTPLHYAASGGEVKCCQILVSRGADRMAVNSNGQVAPGGRGPDLRAELAGARAVAQVAALRPQVPAFPSPLPPAPIPPRHRRRPRRPPPPHHHHLRRRRRRRRGRQGRGGGGGMLRLPRAPLHRRRRSVRARAVPQVRAGPEHGDEGVRGPGARGRRPLPALPQRDRLIQEGRRARRRRQLRRP
ncbi:probable E3 ubiquitin-protein ligase XBOS36 isoform X2 [Brachypodium distachyon]|uniref:probable E3 ubiquitin-protein ligase XBOS36 isoform X2 n=1 Tax=Brachypodium distachyon TaxID=15368 RepID=UPI00071D5A8D|nr:probable E3 ubiquitin-protein ligase XBOS36 isoform X2 [Brachypodium distachyon]|eukprot:XP_014753175.1 probable E3 ubiquitin-protein ligase XBOS36 isoform X2 [Brachypodium distachyon]